MGHDTLQSPTPYEKSNQQSTSNLVSKVRVSKDNIKPIIEISLKKKREKMKKNQRSPGLYKGSTGHISTLLSQASESNADIM